MRLSFIRPQGARAEAQGSPPARFTLLVELLSVTKQGMKDFELYQQILGLTEPWRVEGVKLKMAEKEVEVRVRCAETFWGCQCCLGKSA